MYSLLAIFFLIPLFFSHLFVRLGSGFIIDNGIGYFESVKMHLFLVLIVSATIEMIFQKKIWNQKALIIVGCLMLLVLCGSWMYDSYNLIWLFWLAIGVEEKQDVILLLIFISWLGYIFSRIEMTFQKKIWNQKTLILAVSLTLFVLFGYWIYDHDSIRLFLLGVGEKQHGILLPVSLVWLGYLLSRIEKYEGDMITKAIIISGSLVAVFAVIEGYFHYNLITGADYTTAGSWGTIRSTSTLGNPNYVAGYLLMLLPIIWSAIRRGEKYILLGLILLGIISTGSVIGITLSFIYLLYITGEKLIGKKIYIILPLLLIGTIMTIYLSYSESDKWLSLISRFVLMRETLILSCQEIVSCIFGHGPSGILDMYSASRSPEIRSYFPDNMIIDSSHNIFIDIIVQYGVITLGGAVFLFINRWGNLDTTSKIGLILGLVFLALNVFVISHLILIVYFLSTAKTRN